MIIVKNKKKNLIYFFIEIGKHKKKYFLLFKY